MPVVQGACSATSSGASRWTGPGCARPLWCSGNFRLAALPGVTGTQWSVVSAVGGSLASLVVGGASEQLLHLGWHSRSLPITVIPARVLIKSGCYNSDFLKSPEKSPEEGTDVSAQRSVFKLSCKTYSVPTIRMQSQRLWCYAVEHGTKGWVVGGHVQADGDVKRREQDRRKNTIPSTTLFVVNFDVTRIQERDLADLFDRYGRLTRVQIKKNFAFVQVRAWALPPCRCRASVLCR